MALFNRQKHSDVPPELQPYYDAPTSGPRGWLMWLVRILALLIVLALLFIGGRWAWQKIDNNDKKVGTTQATKQQADKKQSNTTSSATTNSGSSDDTASPSTPPATATPPATSNTATTTRAAHRQPWLTPVLVIAWLSSCWLRLPASSGTRYLFD